MVMSYSREEVRAYSYVIFLVRTVELSFFAKSFSEKGEISFIHRGFIGIFAMSAMSEPIDSALQEETSASHLEQHPSPFDDGELQRRVDNEEDQIDTLVADALKNMTLHERENVYYEQHGVAEEVKEDPQMVSECLEQLELHLHALKEWRGISSAAFKLAELKFPDYCRDRSLRIQFLRAECFVAKKAAERMLRFFELKRTLFGDDKLGKKITMEDLSPDDRHALRKSAPQVLPSRDQGGRLVLVWFPNHVEYKTLDSFVSS